MLMVLKCMTLPVSEEPESMLAGLGSYGKFEALGIERKCRFKPGFILRIEQPRRVDDGRHIFHGISLIMLTIHHPESQVALDPADMKLPDAALLRNSRMTV